MSQDDRTTCSFCEEKPASHVILDRPACSSCSETVCGFYRGEAVAGARIAALMREKGWSYPMIARLLGYSDHTSIMALLRVGAKYQNECKSAAGHKRRVKRLRLVR
jgi:hypothetical protein